MGQVEVQILDFTAMVHGGAMEPSRQKGSTTQVRPLERGGNAMEIDGFLGLPPQPEHLPRSSGAGDESTRWIVDPDARDAGDDHHGVN